MKRITLKLIFDSLMVILMMVLYKKQATGMTFHEIGGLTFLGLVLIHLIINRKWVASVTGKLFAKETKTRVRFMYLDDFLLLIDFILLGIGAVMISKVVFKINAEGMTFKAMHYAAAAVALILIGVHLGLHRKLYFAKCGQTGRKVLFAVFIAIAVFGIYAVTSTSFLRWLSMPFSGSSMGGGSGMMPAGAAGAAAGAAGGAAMHGGEGAGQSFSLLLVLQTIFQFFSITCLFAVITSVIDHFATARSLKKQ